MQVLKYLVVILVIFVNLGQGFPRIDDVTGEDLSDDVTPESLNDGDTAESLNDGDTAESLNDGDTAESLNDGDTAESLNDGDTAESLNDGVTAEYPTTGHLEKTLKPGGKSPGCGKGRYYWEDCNICSCSASGHVLCTIKHCNTGSKKLSAKLHNSAKYKKLQGLATGCLPGTEVTMGNCTCQCSIASVLTCPYDCIA